MLIKKKKGRKYAAIHHYYRILLALKKYPGIWKVGDGYHLTQIHDILLGKSSKLKTTYIKIDLILVTTNK